MKINGAHFVRYVYLFEQTHVDNALTDFFFIYLKCLIQISLEKKTWTFLLLLQQQTFKIPNEMIQQEPAQELKKILPKHLVRFLYVLPIFKLTQ